MRNLCLAAVLVFLMAIPASAFDGKRKGFMLGASEGFTFSGTRQTAPPGLTFSNEDYTVWMVFHNIHRVGWGITDQFALTWSRQIALSENLWAGLEFAYFLSPEAPSMFASVGAAIASWGANFQATDGEGREWAPMASVGWEFSKHWYVQAIAIPGSPHKTLEGLDVETDAFSLIVTVGYLGY